MWTDIAKTLLSHNIKLEQLTPAAMGGIDWSLLKWGPYAGQEVMLMIVRTQDGKWQHTKWLVTESILGVFLFDLRWGCYE